MSSSLADILLLCSWTRNFTFALTTPFSTEGCECVSIDNKSFDKTLQKEAGLQGRRKGVFFLEENRKQQYCTPNNNIETG